MSDYNTIPVKVFYNKDNNSFEGNFNLNAILLEKIEVTTQPDKIVYKGSERLDFNGIEVTATYQDNTTKVVTDLCSYSPGEGELFTGDNVNIVYSEGQDRKECSLELEEIYLTGIKIVEYPENVNYKKDQKIYYNGLEVVAVYSDDSEIDVTSLCEITPEKKKKFDPINDKKVIIKYTENDKTFTTNFYLNHIPSSEMQLKVATMPKYTAYDIYKTDNKIDYTDLVINAVWPDGSVHNVTDFCDYDPAANSIITETTEVIAKCATPLEAVAYDCNTGYVRFERWNYSASATQHYSDIYRVESGHTYLIALGNNKGNYFRAIYTNKNVAEATSNVAGTNIINTANPEANAFAVFTATFDGYIVVYKTSESVTGLKSYVYDAQARNKEEFTYFTLEVRELAIKSLIVTEQPDKIYYSTGEAIDYTGLQAVVTLEDDSEAVYDSDKFTFTPAKDTTFGDNNVNGITLHNQGKSFKADDVVLKYLYPVELIIGKEPSTKSYISNGKADYSDMQVLAKFNNDTTFDVTTISEYTPVQGTPITEEIVKYKVTYKGLELHFSEPLIRDIQYIGNVSKEYYPLKNDKFFYPRLTWFESAEADNVTIAENSGAFEKYNNPRFFYAEESYNSANFFQKFTLEYSFFDITNAQILKREGSCNSQYQLNSVWVYYYGVNSEYKTPNILAEYDDWIPVSMYEDLYMEWYEKEKTKPGVLLPAPDPSLDGVFVVNGLFCPDMYEVTAHGGSFEHRTTMGELPQYLYNLIWVLPNELINLTNLTDEKAIFTTIGNNKTYDISLRGDFSGLTLHGGNIDDISDQYDSVLYGDTTTQVFDVTGATRYKDYYLAIAAKYGVNYYLLCFKIVANPFFSILQKIVVTQGFQKTFKPGEELDFTGVRVNAYYSTGEVKSVRSDCVFDPAPRIPASAAGDCVVDVTYTDSYNSTAKTRFKYEINWIYVLRVIQKPNKNKYWPGEILSYKGLALQAVFEDNTTEDIAFYKDEESGIYADNITTITPAEGSVVTKDTKTVSIGYKYGDSDRIFTASFDILLIEPESLSITPPLGIDFYAGERLVYTNLTAVVTYTDGTKEDVTDYIVCTPNEDNYATANMDKVTVAFTKNEKTVTTTFQIDVIPMEILEVTPPDKTTYTEGEIIDYTGFKAVLYYADKNRETVTNRCVLTPARGSIVTKDLKNIVVTYTNNGGEKIEARVPVTVE